MFDRAISIRFNTNSVLLTILPLSCVGTAIFPGEDSVPLVLPINPEAFVVTAIGKGVGSLSSPLSLEEVTDVASTVWPGECTL